MAEAGARTDHVHASHEPPHPLAFSTCLQFGPASAASLEHGEAEVLVVEQRAWAAEQRWDYGDFSCRKLECEGMLFEDCGLGPAIRPVELGNQRRAIVHTQLVDTIFVAV